MAVTSYTVLGNKILKFLDTHEWAVNIFLLHDSKVRNPLLLLLLSSFNLILCCSFLPHHLLFLFFSSIIIYSLSFIPCSTVLPIPSLNLCIPKNPTIYILIKPFNRGGTNPRTIHLGQSLLPLNLHLLSRRGRT